MQPLTVPIRCQEHYTGYLYSILMNRILLEALARQHALPSPLVARLAATVAERCALIANREGSRAGAEAGPTGACIGAAILAEFAAGDVPAPDDQAAGS